MGMPERAIIGGGMEGLGVPCPLFEVAAKRTVCLQGRWRLAGDGWRGLPGRAALDGNSSGVKSIRLLEEKTRKGTLCLWEFSELGLTPWFTVSNQRLYRFAAVGVVSAAIGW